MSFGLCGSVFRAVDDGASFFRGGIPFCAARKPGLSVGPLDNAISQKHHCGQVSTELTSRSTFNVDINLGRTGPQKTASGAVSRVVQPSLPIDVITIDDGKFTRGACAITGV